MSRDCKPRPTTVKNTAVTVATSGIGETVEKSAQ